ncbi:hypothetical protein D3C75_814980 [compost metagenome]
MFIVLYQQDAGGRPIQSKVTYSLVKSVLAPMAGGIPGIIIILIHFFKAHPVINHLIVRRLNLCRQANLV